MDIKSKGLMPNIELSQKVLEGLEVRPIFWTMAQLAFAQKFGPMSFNIN